MVKKSSSEYAKALMDAVIDKEALTARKLMAEQHPRKAKLRQLAKPEKPKWYSNEINYNDFKIKKGKDKKYYAQHTKWKESVWIGPYSSKKEIDSVINDMIEVSKLSPLKKKEIKNIHSLVLSENERKEIGI